MFYAIRYQSPGSQRLLYLLHTHMMRLTGNNTIDDLPVPARYFHTKL